MRRGRPPYPDLLTPREWEVLALIKDGLTNRQIAQRLRISESGARFHVSEILSKLGVESRREAAAWRGPSKPFALGLLLKWGAAVAVGTAVLVLALLGAGILTMKSRASSDADSLAAPTPTREPESTVPTGTRTGVPEIDHITQAVLDRDSQALVELFKLQDVACTDASGLGGPPKCSNPGGALPEGTIVRAFPVGGCELGWSNDVRSVAENLLGRNLALYGVVEFTATILPYLPQSSNGIILTSNMPNSPRNGVVIHTERGNVVYLDSLCAGPPERVLAGSGPYDGKVKLILKGPAFQ